MKHRDESTRDWSIVTNVEDGTLNMKNGLDDGILLNDGVRIPRLGLGLYHVEYGIQTQMVVRRGLAAGYRLFDTAQVYGNEPDIARVIREDNVCREDMFITTKVWNSSQGYEKTIKACHKSLKRLQTDYIDLYLIHWPVPEKRLETWRALVTLKNEGLCRSIGVSNFMPKHIRELLDASPVVPSVNQVEFNPFIYYTELLALCRESGIQLEAYSPLTRGARIHHPVIASIAREYGKSSAQILIRWALRHDLVVIPKSVHAERIVENSKVFDFVLSDEDVEKLNGLDEHFHNMPPGWNPDEWG